MISLIHILVLFQSILLANQPESDFKVKEQKSRIEMTTPHGLKLYQGNFSLDSMRNYKIKIPLSDLIVKPTPAPEPERAIASATPTPTPLAPPPQASPSPQVSCNQPTPPCLTTDGNCAPKPVEQKREPASIPASPVPEPAKNLKDEEEELPYDDSGHLLVEANRLYNQREYYRALNIVEQVLRKRPSLTRARVMYGSLLYVLGQKELARENWQEAQKREPENIWIQDILKQYP